MAYRKTQQEAETAKVELEALFPEATLEIREFGKGEEWHGYKILESRVCCKCGETYLTGAVGTFDHNICADCSEALTEEYEKESARKIKEANEKQANQVWYDEHMI